MELKSCMDYLFRNPQPSYLRLDKSSNFKIHKKKPKVYPGKWIKVFENKKTDKKKEIYLSTGSVIEFIENSINKKIINKKTLVFNSTLEHEIKKKQSSKY